jgi:hypothetical protein
MLSNLSFNEAAELTRKIKGKRSADDGLAQFLAYVFVFLAVLIGLAAFAAYIIWANAYVGAILWGWFVAPVFGLPLLSKAQAWGIAIMVAFWTHQRESRDNDDESKSTFSIRLITLMLAPWVGLGIGWICHHYFLVG